MFQIEFMGRIQFEGEKSPHRNICVLQEYLKSEGGLSPQAVDMIGELLNEQSLMHLALTELIYLSSDVSDSTE